MVTSDRPPPARFIIRSPNFRAQQLVQTPRFVFFTDDRGMVHCEKVDRRLVCFSSIALRKSKDALVSRESVAFDGVWSTFWDRCNLMLDRGYTLEEDRAYCTPNQWGSVKVLAVVTDMDRGRKLRKLLNANRPDRGRPPEPFTSYVLASIQGHSIDRRELANQYNGPKLTQSEIEWVDNWAAIG